MKGFKSIILRSNTYLQKIKNNNFQNNNYYNFFYIKVISRIKIKIR